MGKSQSGPRSVARKTRSLAAEPCRCDQSHFARWREGGRATDSRPGATPTSRNGRQLGPTFHVPCGPAIGTGAAGRQSLGSWWPGGKTCSQPGVCPVWHTPGRSSTVAARSDAFPHEPASRWGAFVDAGGSPLDRYATATVSPPKRNWRTTCRDGSARPHRNAICRCTSGIFRAPPPQWQCRGSPKPVTESSAITGGPSGVSRFGGTESQYCDTAAV